MKVGPLPAYVLASGLLLASCGGSDVPGEAVPEYSNALDNLDAAVVDGHYHQALMAIRDLRSLTASARSSGDLTKQESDQILAAIAVVDRDLRDLRRPSDVQTDESSPTPEDSEAEPDGQGHDEGERTGHGSGNEDHGNSENAPGHNKND